MSVITAPPEPILRPVVPAVRTLADGREVRRFVEPCPRPGCPGETVVYADASGETLRRRPCASCWFIGVWDRLAADGLTTPSARQAYEAELLQFRGAYPRVAARLARFLATVATELPPGQMFDVGAVRVEPRLAEIAPTLIARHIHGDHGVWGQAPARLDDDMRFAPHLHGQHVVNAVAIEAIDGLVLSRYPRRLGGGWVDIATMIFEYRENETVIVTSEGHHVLVPE